MSLVVLLDAAQAALLSYNGPKAMIATTNVRRPALLVPAPSWKEIG